MKILMFSYWIEKYKKIITSILIFAILGLVAWGGTCVDISVLTRNMGLFGVVGTLVGAIIGGVFSLMGSIWVNNRQQRSIQNMKKKNVIYSPLYDELVDIQNNILEQNPFPDYVLYEKGPQTMTPHPQYDAWRRIKSDTRYLEVPDCLKKQIERLENSISKYMELRYNANDEVQKILNDVLVENGLVKCSIVNIGSVISSDILLNNGADIYEKAIMNDNVKKIKNKKKKVINNEIWRRCNENTTVIEVRKRYEEWRKMQQQTIEILSVMIKKILLKYEA